MVWGGAATMQAETYLSDKAVLFIHVKERALGGTTFGHFHTLLGVGFRFIIN